MTTEQKPELERPDFTISAYRYNSQEEANILFEQLADQIKMDMAFVYQEAFGGPPWFEKFACSSCDAFLPVDTCPACGNASLPPAYPIEQLIGNDFIQMFNSFTPGVLLLVQDTNEKVIGFSTGGITTLDDLITHKYKDDTSIANDIKTRYPQSNNEVIFYDNETCILPDYQKYGIGRKLSEARILEALAMNATAICGRTINIPWLGLKEKQLQSVGYNFNAFNPNGDTYEVDGVKRMFYFAQKN